MIDLHIHTTSSDGEYTPEQIVEKAKKLGISALAITDHDTFRGVERAIIAGKNAGIEVIPGVELSANYKGTMHILGYYFDYLNQDFIDFLDDILEKRNIRNQKFIDYFNSIGFNMTIDEVKKFAKEGTVGKPHFAKLMLEKGYIKDFREAFDLYFEVEPLKSIKKVTYSPKEMIEKIITFGGIPVLAHPKLLELSDEELDALVNELTGYGLKGIEVFHSEHGKEENEKYIKLARKYGLTITAGSDFHGESIKKEVELGTGTDGNVNINDYSIVQELKDIISGMSDDKTLRKSSRLVYINKDKVLDEVSSKASAKVLAFHRIKEGRDYYCMLGGGLEINEHFRDAIVREAKEEISSDIEIKNLMAVYKDETSYQYFFRVELDSSNIKLGSGDEFNDSSRGTYEIAWLDIDKLDSYNLLPREIAEVIKEEYELENKNDFLRVPRILQGHNKIN